MLVVVVVVVVVVVAVVIMIVVTIAIVINIPNKYRKAANYRSSHNTTHSTQYIRASSCTSQGRRITIKSNEKKNNHRRFPSTATRTDKRA
jgi:hypothetical protein